MSKGFLQALALIFIFLKLTGQIDWSWWLVISPVLIPITLELVIFVAAFVVSVYKDKKLEGFTLSEGEKGKMANVLH